MTGSSPTLLDGGMGRELQRRGLASVSGASVTTRESPGNYPLPGADTFRYTSIESVPDFDPAAEYSYVNSYLPIHRAAGVRLFKVIEDNIARREIAIVFREIFRRLPDLEITGEPERLQSFFIHGIKHMPCRFTPGAPSR